MTSSDLTPAVRRLLRLPRRPRGPVAADPAVNETTVDLTQTALDVAANRLLTATAKVDAVLSRTKDRRQRDDLLDIRLSLTGRTPS